jgi:hypothetical protein
MSTVTITAADINKQNSKQGAGRNGMDYGKVS